VQTVAILGAGELGATLARKLAEAERARRVILVDSEAGRAGGRALDILQCGPLEGCDTRVEGSADLGAAGDVDAVVVADSPDLEPQLLSVARALEVAKAVVPRLGRGFLLVANAHAPSLVEAAVRAGLPRDRVLGSAPLAYASALRRRLASAVETEPNEVSVSLFGLPPRYVIVPSASATVGGVPVERLSSTAVRRALEELRRRVLGPVALAAAAARVLGALAGARPTVLPVLALLDGEYGHRGVALAVPARLGKGRVQSVVEVALDPVDRVAFDNAAQERFEAEGA
jgi:malate dehydrogenase